MRFRLAGSLAVEVYIVYLMQTVQATYKTYRGFIPQYSISCGAGSSLGYSFLLSTLINVQVEERPSAVGTLNSSLDGLHDMKASVMVRRASILSFFTSLVPPTEYLV